MNELGLQPSIRGEAHPSVSPRLFRKNNLLLTPLSELTSACRELAGDNIFISFAPPRNFVRRMNCDDDFYENIPEAPSLDAALYGQICSCPGYAAVCASAPAAFWSSLLGPEGYLNCGIDQIALSGGISIEAASSFIENLRNHVEPPGLFAAGLADSLAIQLRRGGLEGGAAWLLITEGQEALISGKIAQWGSSRGFNAPEMEEAMRILRRLDPAPGKNFSQPCFVAADVEFTPENETVKTRLITENMPVLECRFSEFGISPGHAPEEAWMRGEWCAARRALKLAAMRRRTVMRIALYIAANQNEKILDMSLPPRPMTYSSAGAALSLHASTLQRCAGNIHCLIDGRCYPFSIFFSRPAAANKKLSIAAMRARIAELRADGLTNAAIGSVLGVPERTVAYHSAKLRAALRH